MNLEKGLLFGNITGSPTDVVILGAGTVGGLHKTAIGLETSVKSLIEFITKRRLQNNLNQQFYLHHTIKSLLKALRRCDVAMVR
jgi:alanine dehydrogenase